VFADYRPQSLTDARFSLPYLAALQLLRVLVGYEWMMADRWTDSDLLTLARRVRLEGDARMDAAGGQGLMPSRVKLSLFSGDCHEAEVAYPQGHPRNPLSDDELSRKLYSLTEPVAGPRLAALLDAQIGDLEDLPDIIQLARGLATGAAANTGLV
jgi:2-methylcitrate dehydratase